MAIIFEERNRWEDIIASYGSMFGYQEGERIVVIFCLCITSVVSVLCVAIVLCCVCVMEGYTQLLIP